MTNLETINGFLLFLNEGEIKQQLMETGRLYVKIKRKWDRTSVIFFIESKNGIVVNGYGSVDFVFNENELTGLDNFYCRVYGFKQCLGLKNINWLFTPIEISPFVDITKGNIGSLHGDMIEGALLEELLDFLEDQVT
ncbi:hypothetical protein KQH27_00895 [bacterium]|nr:hypothetical protein [bacterium]